MADQAPVTTPRPSYYQQWLKGEGLPVIPGTYIPDLRAVPLVDWDRNGSRACAINHEGSETSNDCYLIEIPPAGELKADRHLYEKMFYVLDGHGTAAVWNGRGGRREFEWAPGSMCAIPLNTWHQLYNASGTVPARLLAVTNAPTVINMYEDADFVYGCEHDFLNRFAGEPDYFSPAGVQSGRYWVSNIVPSTHDFPLLDYAGRGAGGRQIRFRLARNVMESHISEFPVGTYKKAHRHGPGAHVIVLEGEGYSLMWAEGEEPVKYDWKPGSMIIPPDRTFHQHFNVGATPARYLALSYLQIKFHRKTGVQMSSLSTRLGGDQIEYEDESPQVRELYLAELAQRGVTCGMDPIAYAS